MTVTAWRAVDGGRHAAPIGTDVDEVVGLVVKAGGRVEIEEGVRVIVGAGVKVGVFRRGDSGVREGVGGRLIRGGELTSRLGVIELSPALIGR